MGKGEKGDLKKKISQAQQEASELKEAIKQNRADKADTTLKDFAKGVPDIVEPGRSVKCCRTLKGNLGKVYDVEWHTGTTQLVTCYQEGRILLWDPLTGNKLHSVLNASPWGMTCSISPSGKMIASGGLDNICSVFDITAEESKRLKEIQGHEGYLSQLRFVNDQQILMASGDGTMSLCEAETGKRIHEFTGHQADVSCFALSADRKTCVSGSCDKSIILWDMQSGKSIQTFENEFETNSIAFMSNNRTFASGADEGDCRLWDIRAGTELHAYPKSKAPVTSVGFSLSGGLLFTGHDNGQLIVRDTIKTTTIKEHNNHNGRIAALHVSSDGRALATGSFDSFTKVWI